MCLVRGAKLCETEEMAALKDTDDSPDGFVTLDNYADPTPPNRGALRRMAEDVWQRIRPERKQRLKLYDELWEISGEIRDKVAMPPACGPLVDDLDRFLAPFLADQSPKEPTRLIVYPPGNDAAFIREWAEGRSLRIMNAPTREQGFGPLSKAMLGEAESGTVVIPELQHWFLREVGSLEAVRDLLVRVCGSDNRVVLGCDSWAWQFLIKAVDAHHLLPEAAVVQSFSVDRLEKWMLGMVHDAGIDKSVRFRSARDGSDIFDANSEYFTELRLESLGIPWVAWTIWRSSLFTTEKRGLSDAIWVRHPVTPDPPDTDERESLLILHALLIHGGLHPQDLRTVLPIVGNVTVLAMLQRIGLVEMRGERLQVTAKAYPTVKSALEDDGYPGDGL